MTLGFNIQRTDISLGKFGTVENVFPVAQCPEPFVNISDPALTSPPGLGVGGGWFNNPSARTAKNYPSLPCEGGGVRQKITPSSGGGG